MAVSTCNLETLEKLFALPGREISALIQQGVLPQPVAKGEYDSVRSITQYVKHLQEKDQFCSLDHLCEIFDLTARRVAQMVEEGIIPAPIARNRYDEKACVAGYIRYLRQGDKGATFNAHRTRLAKAKADIAALEHAQMAGSLISMKWVEDALVALVSTVRTRLLAIPAKIAARIRMVSSAVEAQHLIRVEIEHALEQLDEVRTIVNRITAQYEPLRGADDWEGDVEVQAATKIDDIAMGGPGENSIA